MSAFYLLSEDGQPALDDEAAAIAKVQQGLLDPESYYWKEGMAEWKPLRELATPLANVALTRRDSSLPKPVQKRSASSPVGARSRSPGFFLRKELLLWTVLLEILIIAWLALDVTLIYTFAGQLYVVLEDPSYVQDQSLAEILRPQLDLLYCREAALIIQYIFFFIWVYRSYKNCRGFTANTRFTSGWSVGYFFIPLLNWFRPYQVMQDIWKISTDPNRALGARDSVLVGIWWTLWLLQTVAGWLFAHPPRDNYLVSVEVILTTYFSLSSLRAIITFILVQAIYLKQQWLTKNQARESL